MSDLASMYGPVSSLQGDPNGPPVAYRNPDVRPAPPEQVGWAERWMRNRALLDLDDALKRKAQANGR